VAHHLDTLESKAGSQRVDVLRRGLLVVPGGGLGRQAESPKVRGDDGVRLGELSDERPPHMWLVWA
jgi:hypothetical protein